MTIDFDIKSIYFFELDNGDIEANIDFCFKNLNLKSNFNKSVFFLKDGGHEIKNYEKLIYQFIPYLSFLPSGITKELVFSKAENFLSRIIEELNNRKDIIKLMNKHLNNINKLELEQYAVLYESLENSVCFHFKVDNEYIFNLEMRYDFSPVLTKELIIKTRHNDYPIQFRCVDDKQPIMKELIKKIINLNKFRIKFLLDNKYDLFKLD